MNYAVEAPSLDWVSSKLQCGLGNRLFQLAAAHYTSVQWNKPLVFAMPYCTPSEHGDFNTIFKLFPNIPKIWKAEAEVSIEQENPFEYLLLPASAPAGRTLLRGFWQAANYVLDTFQPSWTAIHNADALMDRWKLSTHEQCSNTVFLHVRLGDYKVLPHHQVNLIQYFAQCIESFPTSVRFLIFSDTPKEAAALPMLNERCVMVDETDEYNTLFLMSRCWAGAICANSTFSWWGAFFARQAAMNAKLDNYRAYMPSVWLSIPLYGDTKSIYPDWASVMEIN